MCVGWCACVYVYVGACTEPVCVRACVRACVRVCVCVCVCVCVSASARAGDSMSAGCSCFSVRQFHFVLYD